MTTDLPTPDQDEAPDDKGILHLGEGTPDPRGPINTGHGTDPSFAEEEDVPGSEVD
jgi:hypothetical protein